MLVAGLMVMLGMPVLVAAPASAALTTTALVPNAAAIGETITVTGSDFSTAAGRTSIRFGNTTGNNTVCANTTTCTTVVPSGTGTVNVQVQVNGVLSPVNANARFTYAPGITKVSPVTGPSAGGTAVGIDGTNFLANGTTIRFGALAATVVGTCSSTRCSVTSPAGVPGSAVQITASVGGLTSKPAASAFTYTGAIPVPVITSIAPNTGLSIGGNTVSIVGSNFSVSAGAVSVRFGATPAAGVSCASVTLCTATAPAGSGIVDVFVTVGANTSLANVASKYTYLPPPTITTVVPNSGLTVGGNNVTVGGTGFVIGGTSFRFGTASATNVVCINTSSCSMTAPAVANPGLVDVTATAQGQTSATVLADQYTYNGVPQPTITSISPSRLSTVGGTVVTIRGLNLSLAGAAVTAGFGALIGLPTAPCAPVGSCVTVVAPPAGGAGSVNVSVTLTPPFPTPPLTSAANANSTVTYTLPVSDPPATGHQIIVFPQRDFVTTLGFRAADGPFTVEVVRGINVVARVRGLMPLADGTMDVNHPGANCWAGSSGLPNGDPAEIPFLTPDIAPGDIVRVTDALGFVDQTHTADVTADAGTIDPILVADPYSIPAGAPAIRVLVHGTAQDSAGNPLPIAEVQHRFIVNDPRARFLDSARRSLIASSTAPRPGSGDGDLAYDAPGSTHWTATYYLDTLSIDATLATTDAESRAMWVGAGAPAVATDSTIWELGALVSGGPQPPCLAPWEPDTTAPTAPGAVTATQFADPNLDSVHVTWTKSSDNRAVTGYRVYRSNGGPFTLAAVRLPSATSFDDLHIAVGTYTYRVTAVDAAGNESAAGVSGPVTTAVAETPDLTVSKTHLGGDLTVGTDVTYRIDVENVGNFATSGTITVTDDLPAGLTLASVSDAGGSGSPFDCSATVGNHVSCTTSATISLGHGGQKSISVTAHVAIQAYPEVTNSATVANVPNFPDLGDTTPSNDTGSDTSLVNLPAPTTINEPPQTVPLHSLIAFPARDFVHGDGFATGDIVTVEVWRHGHVIAQSRGVHPDADGNVEINHPGGACWGGDPQHPLGGAGPLPATPNLQAGDIVRYISKDGIAQQIHIANVKSLRPTNPAAGVIVVHGSAQNAAGDPMPIDQMEVRLVGGHATGLFEFNGGRRTLRAAVAGGGGDGVIAYDYPGSINFTATFEGLSANDVALALQAESRAQWLGTNALAGNELTIYEIGDLTAKGPSAPCVTPYPDGEPLTPQPDLGITASHDGDLSTAFVPDDFQVGRDAEIYLAVRNHGTAVATSARTLVTAELPAGVTFGSLGAVAAAPGAGWTCTAAGQTVTCLRTGPALVPSVLSESITLKVNVANAAVGASTVVAAVSAANDDEASNNRATDGITTTAAVVLEPDVAISSTHSRTFTDTVGDAYTLTVANAATAGPTTADIVVTDTLPAGLTFVSASGAGTCAAVGQVVTCTITDLFAPGDTGMITVNVAVGAAAIPSVTNQVAVSTVGEGATTLSDNTAADVTAVNPNPSDPTGDLSIIAFPSRDFVSISGLTAAQGPVVVTVRRGGTLVATSPSMTPIDDPTTTVPFDGLVEVNHVGPDDCWDTAPDLRPGDEIVVTDVQGRSFHTFVADIRTLRPVVIQNDDGSTNGIVEFHGTAQSPDGSPLPVGQLEHRVIRPNGQPLFSNGRRGLRTGNDGSISFDGAGAIAWTARYENLTAQDIATILVSESRAVRFKAPLILNDLTIYEDSAGTVGGPAAACVGGASTILADMDVTVAGPAATTVDTAEDLTFTVTNVGPTTGTGSFFSFALPAGMELVGGAATIGGLPVPTIVNGQHVLVPLGDAPVPGTLQVVVRVKATVAREYWYVGWVGTTAADDYNPLDNVVQGNLVVGA